MAALMPQGKQQYFTAGGIPLVGGKVYTYAAGTTTPLATYTTAAAGTPNANPVILDSRGEASIFFSAANYKIVVKDSLDSTIWTQDNLAGDQAATVLANLAASTGSSLVGHIASGAGAVATTVQAKLREFQSAKDQGAVCDGVTDDTAAILSAAATGVKVVVIPPNCLFNRVTLLASLPSSVVCLDFSQINDFTSAGQTTKHVGIITSDVAASDTHWAVDSGHHAILTTNNFGTSGTTSASERKASWLWAVGQYALGGLTNRGFRAGAIQQFTKETGATFWKWQIRSAAPWVSIAGEYEVWATGQTISGAGVYREGPTSQQYVSTGAGTTGATPPTHASGTVSDGGVSWTWIDSADRTLFQCDEYGRWIIGSGNTGDATFNHKVSLTDPNGQYRFQGVSRGVSKYASFKLTPTNAGGTDSVQPYLLAQDGVGLRVMNSAGSSDVGYFSDNGFYGRKQWLTYINFVDTTNSSTTAALDATGKSLIYVINGGATNVTSIAGGTDGQYLILVFQNANTTMVSSGTLLMAGSINITPTAYSVITMLKVPTSISDRWIEVSRSIK